MSVKFELLSPNLVTIIDECLQNEELVRLLFFNEHNPYTLPFPNGFQPSVIAPYESHEKIFPYPFNVKYRADQRSQLHIYYPTLHLINNSNVEQTIVWFDIVVHKKLWLFKQDQNKLVRPYEIASKIASHFSDRSIDTVGRLDFLAMAHVTINEEFDGLRLEAKMTTF